MDRINRELEEYYLARSSGDPETLESLLNLAREIKRLLVPVEPSLGFREGLYKQLSAVVRQRAALRVTPLPANRRWAFSLVAILGSLLPLLGIIAYLLRSRLTRKPQHGASH